MLSLWQGLPVMVRAILSGMLVAAAGTIPWALLVGGNLKFLPSVPWAVPPTILFLWLFWRYLQGEGWPRSTAAARRTSLRANGLSPEVWGASLLAGTLGLITVVLLSGVLNRLARLPQQQIPDLSQIPTLTVAAFLLTSAAVAGIVEEAAYRGYMQGPIERRHGPLAAILTTGTLFGFMHFTHPEVTLILMPYYLAVAAVYGALAWLTNSIWPSMVLHAFGNVFSSIGLLAGGNSEWQASSKPAPLIWETGTDASFWTACAAVVIVGAATAAAYAALAGVARKAQKGEAPT